MPKHLGKRITSRFLSQVELTSQPDHALIDVITIPRTQSTSPWKQLARRVIWAMGLMVFVT
ncbi:Ion channel protein, partial [Corynebacterium amycolatum]|nr:Ion channel protein [Corynebacterium amycolatum]